MNEYNDETLPSKTRLKQEMAELQAYGEQLMALKPEELARLPLTDALHRAIAESRRIKHHEARRRHAQYLGKLMREADGEAIITGLKALKDPLRQQRLVDWVERLVAVEKLADSESLMQELLEIYPHGERQQLRTRVRNLLQSRIEEKESVDQNAREHFQRERRKLFDYLAELEKQAPLY